MLSDLDDSICSPRFHTGLDENIANISMPSTFLDNSKLDDGSFMLTPDSKIGDFSPSMNWSVNSLNSPRPLFTNPEIRNSSLSNEIQLFRRLSQDVNHSRMRFNRTQLLINVMEELFTSSSELPAELRDKCFNQFQNLQFNNFLKGNPQINNLIQVDVPTNKVELSTHESDLLRSVMKNLVSKECSRLRTENELMSSVLNHQINRVSIPGSILNEEEAVTLDRVADIASLTEECAENMKTAINLNDELYEVHATKFRELQKAEMESLLNKTKQMSLQIKNLNYTIEDAFVQQFDKMGEAVNVLHKELQNSLHEAEYMLQKTKSLKDKYDQVRGNKFDEILEEYTVLRDNYKHKSWALKQIAGGNI